MSRPFAFRPGEPRNPLAWLGVAPLIRARRFPFRTMTWGAVSASFIRGRWNYKSIAIETMGEADLRLGRAIAPSDWRRVLLPMLLEEAKKRGIDV